jgi:hypothetical protein
MCTASRRSGSTICFAWPMAKPEMFMNIVGDKYLPKERAANCSREYHQVRFAFQKLILPHVDKELVAKVLKMDWLPNPEKMPAR